MNRYQMRMPTQKSPPYTRPSPLWHQRLPYGGVEGSHSIYREPRRSLEIHRRQMNWSRKAQFQIWASESYPNQNEEGFLYQTCCFINVLLCELQVSVTHSYSPSGVDFHICHLELCEHWCLKIPLLNNEFPFFFFFFCKSLTCNKDPSS